MKKLLYILGFAGLIAAIPSCKKSEIAPENSIQASTIIGEPIDVDAASMGGKVNIRLVSSPGRHVLDNDLIEVNSTAKMIPPTDLYTAINVDIRSIRIHSAERGWMTLETKSGIYNLLNLQSKIGALLVDKADTEAKLIDKIELVLGRENTVAFGEATYPLIAPNPDYAAIMVNVDASVDPRRTLEITLDFNAYASVVEKPKPNDSGFDFFLQPKIKVKSVNYIGATTAPVL